jgi:glutamate dehydrogenase (NAD(P)+)
VNDSTGAIHNAKGLDVEAVMRHKAESGSVVGYRPAEAIGSTDLLALQCDILVPAVLEQQINEGNAASIKARMIVEGANGPTTAEATRILRDKGVFIVPDILANAGGVVVSYFEWVQGLQSFFWTEEEVNQRLQHVMDDAFHEVLEISQREKVDMREAAYMLAIGRVAKAMMIRGIYP